MHHLRRFVTTVVAVVFALSAESFAQLPVGEGDATPAGYRIGTYRPGSSERSFGSPIDCTYSTFRLGVGSPDTAAIVLIVTGGVERIDSTGTAFRAGPDDEPDLKLFFRSGADCADGLIWVSTGLTAASLLPALRQELERTLPLPEPNISPDPSVGSFANLGLWVAIDDPGIISDRLTDGPVWAEATATLTNFDVDYGVPGTTQQCTGTGTPYPDGSNNPDQGPCGHTYTQPSPEGSPYKISITANYDVTYRLSDGGGGSLGVVDRPTSISYVVDEVQIIGTNR